MPFVFVAHQLVLQIWTLRWVSMGGRKLMRALSLAQTLLLFFINLFSVKTMS